MFFRNNTGGAEWLLVGLGNPGTQYENTRHNVGFLVADELAERQNAPIQRLKFKALTNLLTISGEKVLVMKPVTYMNLSGEAVRQAVDFYKIPPERVLVVSDWVLGKFQGEDKKAIDGAVKRAADAVECLLKEGPDRAMNRFNG